MPSPPNRNNFYGIDGLVMFEQGESDGTGKLLSFIIAQIRKVISSKE